MSDLSEIGQQLDALLARIESYEKLLDRSGQIVDEIQHRFGSHVSDIASLQQERTDDVLSALDSLSTAVSQVADNASDGYGRIVAAKEAVESRYHELEAALNDFGQQIEKDGDALQAQVAAIVEQAVSQVESLRGAIESFGSEIDDRLAQLDEAERSVGVLLRARILDLLEQEAVMELKKGVESIVDGLEVPTAAVKNVNRGVEQTLGRLQNAVSQIEAPLEQLRPALELMKYVG